MSAFCGVVDFSGETEKRELAFQDIYQPLSDMKYDKASVWRDQFISLGHYQYNITPESYFESHPLVDESAGLVIMMHGMLTNRKDLFNKLGIRDRHDQVITDLDFIRIAYLKWGPACPQYLIGEYVFIIWQPKQRRLFSAVSPTKMGLYFKQQGNRFYFSSNMQPLRQCREIEAPINEDRIYDYLALCMPPRKQTFYKGIYRLRPGHTLMVEPDKKYHINQYFSMAEILKDKRKVGKDEDVYEEARELLFEVLRGYARSNDPIATHCSGGLDSSTITCCMAQIMAEQGREVHAYCSVPPKGMKPLHNRPGWSFDDRQYAQAVADMYPNVRLHMVEQPVPNYLNVADIVSKYSDCPTVNVNNFKWHFDLADLSYKNNSTLLLTGNSGNATISWDGGSKSVYTFVKTLLKLFYFFAQHKFGNKSFDLPLFRFISLSSNRHSYDEVIRRACKRYMYTAFNDSRLNMLGKRVCPGMDNGILSLLEGLTGVSHLDPLRDMRLTRFCYSVPQEKFYSSDKLQKRYLVRLGFKRDVPNLVLMRHGRGEQGNVFMLSYELYRHEYLNWFRLYHAVTKQNSLIDEKILTDLSGRLGSLSSEFAKKDRLYYLTGLTRIIQLTVWVSLSR